MNEYKVLLIYRICVIILLLLILLSGCSPVGSQREWPIGDGDVNRDRISNCEDAQIILDELDGVYGKADGTTTFPHDAMPIKWGGKGYADVDGDGILTQYDAYSICPELQ